MKFLDSNFSRNTFLKISIKVFAITALSIEGINCGRTLVTPILKGISTEEYFNMHSVAEIFLEGNPVPEFDIGKALDDYIRTSFSNSNERFNSRTCRSAFFHISRSTIGLFSDTSC